MIQILLLILKIFGIILLVILGSVLLILALVLFVPVCYRGRFIHNPDRTEITAGIRFLFPLLNVVLHYLEQFSYKVRVFGYAILDSEKQEKQKPEKAQKNKKKEKIPVEEVPVEVQQSSAVQQDEVKSLPKDRTEQSLKPEKKEKKADSAESGKKEKKPEKEKKTIRQRLEKLKVLWHRKEEVQRILNEPESRQAISFVWNKCKHLFRHILPRKINGYLAYGSSDPATTGKVLGIISVVYAKTGPLVELRPNFEEEQLECDIELKGHIQLFTLLVIAGKVFFNKELRQMIEKLKHIKEIT